ncbi:MAG: hypothetical protein GY856_32270 [bacterium]|nr:hypothetical protein [bacterium]
MRIVLEGSGGLAHLRIRGELNTGELAADLTRKVEQIFHPEKLEAAGAVANPQMTDAQQYQLTVMPQSGEGDVRHYQLDDSCLSPELLDVLDELMHEIIRRKAAALGR